jgi:hypothetical protein
MPALTQRWTLDDGEIQSRSTTLSAGDVATTCNALPAAASYFILSLDCAQVVTKKAVHGCIAIPFPGAVQIPLVDDRRRQRDPQPATRLL